MSSTNMIQIKKVAAGSRKTSLTLDYNLYTDFSIEAKRRHMTTTELMEYAMRLVLKEKKRK